MFSSQDIIGSDVLDHLGLVAATIDKLGIGKQIDRLNLDDTLRRIIRYFGDYVCNIYDVKLAAS